MKNLTKQIYQWLWDQYVFHATESVLMVVLIFACIITYETEKFFPFVIATVAQLKCLILIEYYKK